MCKNKIPEVPNKFLHLEDSLALVSFFVLLSLIKVKFVALER